jgi:uncharacterized protein involved in exopolysaccharide biosynthesis
MMTEISLLERRIDALEDELATAKGDLERVKQEYRDLFALESRASTKAEALEHVVKALQYITRKVEGVRVLDVSRLYLVYDALDDFERGIS